MLSNCVAACGHSQLASEMHADAGNWETALRIASMTGGEAARRCIERRRAQQISTSKGAEEAVKFLLRVRWDTTVLGAVTKAWC